MKAAAHKQTTVWLHFDKAPRIDKFIETEAWVVVARNRGAGGRGHGDLLFNESESQRRMLGKYWMWIMAVVVAQHHGSA